MDNSMDAHQFRDLFDSRAIVIADLAPGTARELATAVNRPAGPQEKPDVLPFARGPQNLLTGN